MKECEKSQPEEERVKQVEAEARELEAEADKETAGNKDHVDPSVPKEQEAIADIRVKAANVERAAAAGDTGEIAKLANEAVRARAKGGSLSEKVAPSKRKALMQEMLTSDFSYDNLGPIAANIIEDAVQGDSEKVQKTSGHNDTTKASS